MAPLDDIRVFPRHHFDEGAWYWRLPPVAQLRAEGLRLTAPVTVLVGRARLGQVDSGRGRLLRDLAAEGSQVIMATHSPLLAAFPGAAVLEIGDHGIRSTSWEDLDVVAHWRSFLDEPRRYLRHL